VSAADLRAGIDAELVVQTGPQIVEYLQRVSAPSAHGKEPHK